MVLLSIHKCINRKKSSKYFVQEVIQPKNEQLNIIQAKEQTKAFWRIKSREEFTDSLTREEIEKYGGQAKLEQQPTNRYFKKKLLSDIVMHTGNVSTHDEREAMIIFVHFLKG
jgi:hypothetical protein